MPVTAKAVALNPLPKFISSSEVICMYTKGQSTMIGAVPPVSQKDCTRAPDVEMPENL